MANETNITVIGNLTDDPELKFTPSGTAVANVTVASTPRTFDRQSNEWKDGEPLFFRCAAWREMAENVAGSLTKGQRVIVTGALRIRQFERQDGTKGTSVEINVDEIGPSLRYATATVQRTQRTNGSQPAPTAQASNPWSTGPAQAAAPLGGNAWATQPSDSEPPF